jgi:hypothetical protein
MGFCEWPFFFFDWARCFGGEGGSGVLHRRTIAVAGGGVVDDVDQDVVELGPLDD